MNHALLPKLKTALKRAPIAGLRWRRLKLLLLVSSMLLSPILAATAATPGTRLEMAGIDGGKAILNLASSPLVTMTPTPFQLMLTDATGAPITDTDVDCDLSMPAMPMPENRPAIKEKDGAYRGEAVFTMAGDWRATFSVRMPDGRLERLIFSIDGVLLK